MPHVLLDTGPFGPMSSKAIQGPKVRVLSLAGRWLTSTSTSTWNMTFRDCRPSCVGLPYVFRIFPLTTSTAQ